MQCYKVDVGHSQQRPYNDLNSYVALSRSLKEQGAESLKEQEK